MFADLVARGLVGVRLVTSDAHTGLVEAVAADLPGAVWQRCRTHCAANLMSVCPKSMWHAVKAMLRSVYYQPDADAVHAQFDRLLDYVEDKLTDAFDHLDTARAAILAFTQFPEGLWQRTGTRSSASPAPSSPSRLTNGQKAAATSDSTSSRSPTSPPPPARDRGGGRHRPRTHRLTEPNSRRITDRYTLHGT